MGDNGERERKSTSRSAPNTRRKIVGFRERLEEKREARARSNKPLPWIQRKLAVGIVFGLVGYTWYVYIGTFIVKMIRRDGDALGSRNEGIAFLVVYCILGLMFFWTYFKVVLTPPGFAIDYVAKTTASESDGPADRGGLGIPYEAMPPDLRRPPPSMQRASSRMGQTQATSISAPRQHHGSSRRKEPPKAPSSRPTHSRQASRSHSESGARGSDDVNAGTLDALRPNPAREVPVPRPPPAQERRPSEHRGTNGTGQPPVPGRMPPYKHVLAPENRYCRRCHVIKPMRAHHCRSCGTCVLMYDHHCPWTGQCVGARNHKFFVNFLQWSTPWTLWIFLSVLVPNVKHSGNATFNVNPQHIVIMALSGFFTIFTAPLLLAHVYLIMHNLSSVESLIIRGMKADEGDILNQLAPAWRIWKRRAIRRQWDEEWGDLHTEANIWWLEGARANWEATMGKSMWGWLLPVGRPQGDGLTYPVNPRFGEEGRWRRRSEWPPELR